MLHGVDQILVYRCMTLYEFVSYLHSEAQTTCNRHTSYSDMHEKVHRVIGIKDVLLDVRVNVSIMLDNDTTHK